jgi:hypothetical protein
MACAVLVMVDRLGRKKPIMVDGDRISLQVGQQQSIT